MKTFTRQRESLQYRIKINSHLRRSEVRGLKFNQSNHNAQHLSYSLIDWIYIIIYFVKLQLNFKFKMTWQFYILLDFHLMFVIIQTMISLIGSIIILHLKRANLFQWKPMLQSKPQSTSCKPQKVT